MTNVLLPTVELHGRLTPFHVIRTSEVSIDTSECFKLSEWDKNTKQNIVYYGLGKPALAKIAQAAGISWDASLTGVIGNPTADYLMYRAVARMSLPDGQPAVGIGTVEWFASEEVEPVRIKLAQAKASGESQKAAGLAKALSDAVKYRVPNAESKAMNRAIRQLLGIKAKYRPEELTEAFVVPRVEYVPDITDPNVRELLMARADVSRHALYGASGIPTNAPALLPPDDETDEVPLVSMVLPASEPEETEAEDVPFDDFEDVGEAEVVEADPGDYVITDERSTFKGMTLHQVEAEMKRRNKGSYCRFIINSEGKGSPELRQACEDYSLAYLDQVDGRR